MRISMFGRIPLCFFVALTAFGCVLFANIQVDAQQIVPTNAAEQPARATANRPVVPSREDAAQHPLAWVLKYAREEQAYLQRHIRNFTARLTKRDRIAGRLQEYQNIDSPGR